MSKLRKTWAMLLAVAIVAGMFAAMPLTAGARQEYTNVRTETELYNALYGLIDYGDPNDPDDDVVIQRTADDLTYIYLANSIDFRRHPIKSTIELGVMLNDSPTPITDSSGKITSYRYKSQHVVIVLNGYTLTVSGIWLRGAHLTVTGTGTLNVEGGGVDAMLTTEGHCAIWAQNAPNQWEGNNRSGEIKGYAASSITMGGGSIINVSASRHGNRVQGVRAENGSTVEITGSVTVSGERSHGVYADRGAEIRVSRNVSAAGTRARAVFTDNGSRISVGDNAIVSGTDSYAAHTKDKNDLIFISEDAKATGIGSYGVMADGGRTYVGGDISGGRDAVLLGGEWGRAMSSPTTRSVVQTETRYGISGYYWDEYRYESSYVYKRSSGTSGAAGWQKSGNNWYYYVNGNLLRNDWVLDGGIWYFMKSDGAMADNEEITWNRQQYRLKPGGAMLTGWYLGNKDRAWYYYGSSGAQVKGDWVLYGGKWYWLKTDGRMAANETLRINGENHSFDANGAWLGGGSGSGSSSTGAAGGGWVQQGSTWYYNKANGTRAASEWLQVGGVWYYFNANASMATGWITWQGNRYYLTSSGAMATGWLYIGGAWYYFNGSGAMASNQWILSGGTWYWLKTDGKMVANTSMSIGGKTYNFAGSGACTNPY